MRSIIDGKCSVMGNYLAEHGLSQLPQEMIHLQSDTLYSHYVVDVVLNLLNCDYSRSSDLNLLLTSAA